NHLYSSSFFEIALSVFFALRRRASGYYYILIETDTQLYYFLFNPCCLPRRQAAGRGRRLPALRSSRLLAEVFISLIPFLIFFLFFSKYTLLLLPFLVSYNKNGYHLIL